MDGGRRVGGRWYREARRYGTHEQTRCNTVTQHLRATRLGPYLPSNLVLKSLKEVPIYSMQRDRPPDPYG